MSIGILRAGPVQLVLLVAPQVSATMDRDIHLPQIPPKILDLVLPDKELSILDFLKFRLPAVAQAANGFFDPSQKFLSSLTPTLTQKSRRFRPYQHHLWQYLMGWLKHQNYCSHSQSSVCTHQDSLWNGYLCGPFHTGCKFSICDR